MTIATSGTHIRPAGEFITLDDLTPTQRKVLQKLRESEGITFVGHARAVRALHGAGLVRGYTSQWSTALRYASITDRGRRLLKDGKVER